MLSQFDDEGTISGAPITGREADVKEIHVGGPLTLDPEDHELPITIQVMVVQTPESKPGEEDEERFEHDRAKIARGVVVIKKGDLVVGEKTNRWDVTLTVPADDFKDGEARGIAVAVVPNPKRFAYETLTWCEHIKLKVEEPAAY